MATINATVYWDSNKNKPKVDPNPIPVPSADGATTINWTAGDGIASFEIRNLDTNEFTFIGSNSGTSVTAQDRNDSPNTYHYKVRATHTSGLTAEHDPRIENGSGAS